MQGIIKTSLEEGPLPLNGSHCADEDSVTLMSRLTFYLLYCSFSDDVVLCLDRSFFLFFFFFNKADIDLTSGLQSVIKSVQLLNETSLALLTLLMSL